MKKIVSVLAILSLLSACATSVSPKMTQREKNQESIRKIQNVEIFYHDDDYVVTDGGGSSVTGFGGLLGPIGALVEAGINARSKLTVAERTEERSKEFTKSIRQHFPDQDVNRDFANQLAALVQQSGRAVKVTKIKRPLGDLVTENPPESVVAEDNYVPVMLRITTGYGARTTTDDYRPIVLVDFALARNPKQVFVRDTFEVKDGEKTYSTYSGLLSSDEEARGQLKKILMDLAPKLYKEMFDLPQLSSK